jgi:hypothetical protein
MKTVKKQSKTTKTTARKTALVAKSAAAAGAKTPKARIAKPARVAPTTIEVRVDVGFGNNLFIRGQGAGLSWDQGVPLTNVDTSTWQWTTKAGENLTFKLLINDAVWCQGADIVATPGQKVEIIPNF